MDEPTDQMPAGFSVGEEVAWLPPVSGTVIITSIDENLGTFTFEASNESGRKGSQDLESIARPTEAFRTWDRARRAAYMRRRKESPLRSDDSLWQEAENEARHLFQSVMTEHPILSRRA